MPPSLKTKTFTLALGAIVCAALALGPGVATAAWEGRNGPIAFAGGGAAQGSGIWSKQLGSKQLRRITQNSTDSQPQVSPDGRWLVFVRQVTTPLPGNGGGTFPATHLFRVRANGTGLTAVTSGPSYDSSPSFAPSGDRLIFARTEYGTAGADIYSVRLDGSKLHAITSGAPDDRNPVFSPRGNLIAFDRFDPPGKLKHVHTMRPNGSRIVDATPSVGPTSQPDFSPAGDRILFVKGVPGDPGAIRPGKTGSDLFTMRPNGAGVRRLTGIADRERGGFSDPVYSPDGRSVVAELVFGNQFSKLQVVHVRSRAWGATLGGRRMARTPDATYPVWMPR